MIAKLYNLKKTQTDRKLMEKGQLLTSINSIDDEIILTQNKINVATVQKFGAISDFSILQIHKNTMKMHILKLEDEKKNLENEVEIIIKEIIELQKETEQFGYMLEEEKKEKLKKILSMEEEASSEYMQSKYIKG